MRRTAGLALLFAAALLTGCVSQEGALDEARQALDRWDSEFDAKVSRITATSSYAFRDGEVAISFVEEWTAYDGNAFMAELTVKT